jgi:hypothetical protein
MPCLPPDRPLAAPFRPFPGLSRFPNHPATATTMDNQLYEAIEATLKACIPPLLPILAEAVAVFLVVGFLATALNWL